MVLQKRFRRLEIKMTEKTKRIGSPSATAALGEEPVPRLVLRFAATTMAALLLNAVYTLTDTLFVSWGVGENAMGGVSVVFPFVILQGAISTALGGGAASIISRKLGEGKKQEAGEARLLQLRDSHYHPWPCVAQSTA
jgi:Na+-driven multidrug efflux pump